MVWNGLGVRRLVVVGILGGFMAALVPSGVTSAAQVIPCPQAGTLSADGLLSSELPGVMSPAPPRVLNPCPGWEWAITLGTGTNDWPFSLWTTLDGGIVLAVNSPGNFNSDRSWVARFNVTGEILVQGAGTHKAKSIRPTADGGFVLAGALAGTPLLSKYDAALNLEWQKEYDLGGSGLNTGDSEMEVAVTPDGGFVVGTYTNALGAGDNDFWVFRVDSAGNHVWGRTFGGANSDFAESVIVGSDGGIVVAGATRVGNSFYPWIVRLDGDGNAVWRTYLSGSGVFNSVRQAADGGYLASGRVGSRQSIDILVVKFSPAGAVVWQKVYNAGQGMDIGHSLYATSDGGAVVAGAADAGVGRASPTVLRIDANGNVLWRRTYSTAPHAAGTGVWCFADCIVQMADGGFAMATMTDEFGAGGDDVLVVRLAPNGTVSPTCPLSIGQSVASSASNGKLKASSPTLSQGFAAPTVSDEPSTSPGVTLSADLICRF